MPQANRWSSPVVQEAPRTRQASSDDTIFHEAGHAVTALALGCQIDGIDVIPRDGQKSGVTYLRRDDMDPVSKIAIHLAGAVASLKSGSKYGDDTGDQRKAADVAHYAGGERTLERGRSLAVQLVNRYWSKFSGSPAGCAAFRMERLKETTV
jgi:hypothetical protein